MVRASQADNLGLRPTFYLAFWESPGKRVGDTLEPVYSIPPTDGQAHRTNQPMGGTVSSPGGGEHKRLGSYPSIGNPYAQQCLELDNKIYAESAADRARTVWAPQLLRNDPEPIRQGTRGSTRGQSKTRDPGP